MSTSPVWMAATRAEAHAAFDRAQTRFSAKYPKAMECLSKDRQEMLAFYDYPAEHGTHIRTTNPIESTIATVRLRAEKRWKKLCVFKLLGKVVEGFVFIDRIEDVAA